jgi:ABC-2 type transport system permease protein
VTTIALGAVRLQLAAFRHSPGDLLTLLSVPLFTAMFLTIMRHAGRDDLAAYAVLAPGVIAVWQMALFISGELVDKDRSLGTLEALLATPGPLGLVIFGRVATVTLVSLLAIAESALVARIFFGVGIDVPHPGLFAATLAVTALAMAGTATAMSAIFVLARSARTFQSSLSYPFLVLGGALVPVDLLPAWLQPLCRLVFLSWSSDLLRGCLSHQPVPDAVGRLAVIVLLGMVSLAGGLVFLRWVAQRIRTNGSVSYA